jgi:hypothetical protein
LSSSQNFPSPAPYNWPILCTGHHQVLDRYMPFALPTICTMLVAVAFLVLERLAPGRELPHAPGWYARAVVINATQALITFGTNRLWVNLLSGASLFNLAEIPNPVMQGFIGRVVGTFFFYWWHRIRHIQGFWVVFHQVHHSPARIEAMTAFYKHPVEILADSALAALILYPLLGARSRAHSGSTFSPPRVNSSTTPTSRRRAGSNTLSRRPNCTRSTINWMCIASTSRICRCGTVFSERIAMPICSPNVAAFPATMNAS